MISQTYGKDGNLSNEKMKKTFLFIILCCICTHRSSGQNMDDFAKQFDNFRKGVSSQFEAFRDSANRVYAEYLSHSWEVFQTKEPIPVPRKPLPFEGVIYVPDQDSTPVVLPVDTLTVPSRQDTEVYIPEVQKVKTQPGRRSLLFRFFDVPVEMSRFDEFRDIRLSSSSENQVSSCWLQLSQTPWQPFLSELQSLKDELNLNDWGFYQLLVHTGETYFLPELVNEKALFCVFMLNQAGYRVKTGRQGKRLFPLIAFHTEVYGKPYITFSDGNYFVISSEKTPATEVVYSYRLNYEKAIAEMDLAITKPFRLDLSSQKSNLSFSDKTYMIEYNANLISFYDTYPQTVLSVYANTPLSSVTRKSLEKELLPSLKDKTEEEAVVFLLSFVQQAFAYKTDMEQFGYEKYFFAEELFHYPYSDCEDRSVLFSQLVRRFLGLEVVLLDYPDHVATGVKFSKPLVGDYVIVNNEQFIVCDPVYIGAPLGRTMTKYRNINARIIALK